MQRAVAFALVATGALAVGAFALQGNNLSIPVMNWAKPVEQHEFLKSLEGIWDADIKLTRSADQPAFSYSGQEIVRSSCGGLFTTFELDAGDKENGYSSRALIGFDPKMSKYNAVFADKSGASWSKLEAAFNKDSKTVTFVGDGPDMRYVDKRSKFEYVWTFGKKNERTTTVTILEDDGKRTPWMEIQYKFKKKK